jgi:hypothetical protein
VPQAGQNSRGHRGRGADGRVLRSPASRDATDWYSPALL